MPPKVAPAEAPAEGGAVTTEEGGKKKKGGCCCGGGVQDDGPFQAKADFWEQKSCHDCWCCIVFVAYALGMVIILSLSLTNRTQSILSLIYGTDHGGFTCGANNEQVDNDDGNDALAPTRAALDLKLKKYLHFPLEANFEVDPADPTLYGICVTECPATVGTGLVVTDSSDGSSEAYSCDCLSKQRDWKTSCPSLTGLVAATTNGAGPGWTPTGSTDPYPSPLPAGVLGGTKEGRHDCICEYDGTKCWDRSYPTQNTLFRCIPCQDPTREDCTPENKATTRCRNSEKELIKTMIGYDQDCGTDASVAIPWQFGTVVGDQTISPYAGLYPDNDVASDPTCTTASGVAAQGAACTSGAGATCSGTTCTVAGVTIKTTTEVARDSGGAVTGALACSTNLLESGGYTNKYWSYRPVSDTLCPEYWTTYSNNWKAWADGTDPDVMKAGCTAATKATCPYYYASESTKAAAGTKYIISETAEAVGTTGAQGVVTDAIGGATSGLKKTIMGFVGDIFNARWVILVNGAPAAFIGTVFWIMLLKYMVKPFTYIIILLVFVMLAGSTLAAAYKAGMWKGEPFASATCAAVAGQEAQPATDAAGAACALNDAGDACAVATGNCAFWPDGTMVTDVTDPTELTLWELVAWTFAILTAVYVILICMKLKQIRMATSVIKEASNAIKAMPMMLFFPFAPMVVVMLALGYYLIGGAYIMTASSISADDMVGQVNSAVQAAASAAGNFTISNATIGVADASGSENIQFYLFWYHTFGWLWIHQTTMAVTMTSIAGGVSFWYFAGKEGRENPEDPAHPKVPRAFLRAAGRVFRYHFGSMLFGAAIVAMVQLIRMIMAYVDSQTKAWQNKSKVLKIMFKVVQCIMWCFEKILKFITRRAYIMIAINGKGFCRSAKHAFMTIIKNLFLIGFVEVVSNILILLGKLAIAGGGAFLTWMYVTSWGNFTTDERLADASIKDPAEDDLILLSSEMVPVLITLMLGFATSSVFFYSYQMAIDTITLCFLEEKKGIDNAVDSGKVVVHVGPDSLVDFMKKNDARMKKAAKAKAEGEKHHGDEDEKPKEDAPADDATKEEAKP